MSDRLWQRGPDGEVARSPEPPPLPEGDDRPDGSKRANALLALKLPKRIKLKAPKPSQMPNLKFSCQS